MLESNTRVPIEEPSKNTTVGSCCAAIREMLSRVGDKWSVLIVSILSDEPLRFNELRRRVDGISQRMLTRTLRELERDGMVTRTVTPTTPPSVEYALTNLGYTLLDPVRSLILWTQANYPTIVKAQQKFDRKHPKEIL